MQGRVGRAMYYIGCEGVRVRWEQEPSYHSAGKEDSSTSLHRALHSSKLQSLPHCQLELFVTEKRHPKLKNPSCPPKLKSKNPTCPRSLCRLSSATSSTPAPLRATIPPTVAHRPLTRSHRPLTCRPAPAPPNQPAPAPEGFYVVRLIFDLFGIRFEIEAADLGQLGGVEGYRHPSRLGLVPLQRPVAGAEESGGRFIWMSRCKGPSPARRNLGEDSLSRCGGPSPARRNLDGFRNPFGD